MSFHIFHAQFQTWQDEGGEEYALHLRRINSYVLACVLLLRIYLLTRSRSPGPGPAPFHSSFHLRPATTKNIAMADKFISFAAAAGGFSFPARPTQLGQLAAPAFPAFPAFPAPRLLFFSFLQCVGPCHAY